MTVVLMSAPSGAATINEGSLGDFSNDYAAPTVIGNGYETVDGATSVGDLDFVEFNGLAAGAQTVSVTFTSPSVGSFFISSGTLRYSTQPFTTSTDGTLAGAFSIYDFGFFSSTTQTLSFNLDSSFNGSLFVSLALALGSPVSYSISIPGNAPAPVPLPASAALLLAGLGGVGAVSWRRRARRAA
ncbi:PEP-CTERM sorting domain-containing protein [Defluviimonas denitrificans]|uniref:PEP-CTERM sorting domain-containing protein n=1 Tax=Albidovulum denitrificans TaxID=404881 RepID=UPI001FE8DC79|nr:PEP-CTERM sorting domain-containing protein [Defluviimonas denitrificans]